MKVPPVVRAELDRQLDAFKLRWSPDQIDLVADILATQTSLLARKALGEDVDANLGQCETQLAGLAWVEARVANRLAAETLTGVFRFLIAAAITAL